MPGAAGYRMKFGLIVPSTNTVVEADYNRMGGPRPESHTKRLGLGCVRCRDLPRSALVCGLNIARVSLFNNRSKFNVALGIEAQGSCAIQLASIK